MVIPEWANTFMAAFSAACAFASLVMVVIIATMGGKTTPSGTSPKVEQPKVTGPSGPAIKTYQKQVADEIKAEQARLAQERLAAEQAKEQAMAMAYGRSAPGASGYSSNASPGYSPRFSGSSGE